MSTFMISQRPHLVSENRIFTSKIVEWDDQKGFGYLHHQKGKLFLHRKDFAERHKRPSKGDNIHYQVGYDPKGRSCAVAATHVNDGGKITILTWISLLLLMATPAIAWSHFILIKKPSLLFLILPFAVINLITYLSYRSDKKKSRAKEWRTSEATLHFLELFGGWPAALLAQRQFRHKYSKIDFQIIYWMIVILHLYLAIDYIFDWKIFRSIWHSLTI